MARQEDEVRALRNVLRDLRPLVVHRALAAWRRSPETFSDEIVALNDIHEALENLGERQE